MAKKAKEITPEDVAQASDEELVEIEQAIRTDEPEEAVDAPQEPIEADKPKVDVSNRTRDPDGKFVVEDKKLPDDDEEDVKSETVPFGKFDQERHRRKAAEESARELEARYAKRLEQVLETVTRQPEPQVQEPQAPPPFLQDPSGAFGHYVEEQKRLGKTVEEISTSMRQAQEQQQFASYIAQQEQEFQTQAPDYPEAVNYLLQSREREYALIIPDPQQRRAYIAQEANNYMRAAIDRGMSVPELFYKLAKERGFVKTNGGDHAAQPLANSAPAAAALKANQQQGKDKALSLSSGGGSPAVTDHLSPQQILELSDADFDAYMAKHGGMKGALAKAS